MNDAYAYGLWSLVIINTLFFILFIAAFLLPRQRWEWRSLGVFSAFIVALFAEMYGFPLTIYVLLSLLGYRYPTLNPFSHTQGHLWVTLTGGWRYATFICSLGSLLILSGLIMVGLAWRRIHGARGGLVTDGIYRYIRHSQYAGLFLTTLGMLIQWPTILTLLMWPILILTYYRLAIKEERDMVVKFGTTYLQYKKVTPMFVPSFSSLFYRSWEAKDGRQL